MSINIKVFLDDRTLHFFTLWPQERQTEVLDMSFPVFSGLVSAELGREAKMTKQMGLLFR